MCKYIIVIEYDIFLEVDEKIYDLRCTLEHTEQLTYHSFF